MPNLDFFQGFRRVVRAAVTGDLSGATKPSPHDAIHWGTVLVTLLGVTWVIHLLESNPAVLGYRYGMFQLLSRIGATDFNSRDVVVVLVDDDTYWRGEPAGRVPTDRRYLAKLLNLLVQAEPQVLALDFDLRSPDPDGKIRSSAAAPQTVASDRNKGEGAETQGQAAHAIELPVNQSLLDESIALFEAADRAAETCPVVLPRTVKRTDHGYRAVADSDDGFPYSQRDVSHGYIQLADDRRVIPPQLELEDGTHVDSFCLAIFKQAKSSTSQEADSHDDHHHAPTRYASFLPRNMFNTVTTSELFSGSKQTVDQAKASIRGKIILIGADWHSRSLGAGPHIDSHPSPAGLLPGVMLHASYVESLLQDKYVTPAGMKAAMLAEWALTALIAFIMIAKIGWKAKIAWFAGILAVYPLLSLVSMRFLGVYTDVLLLTVALGLHLLADLPTRFVHLTLKVKELDNRLANRHVKGH